MGLEEERFRTLDAFAAVLGVLSFFTLVLFFGFPDIRIPSTLLLVWTALLPTALFLESLYRLQIARDPWRYLKKNPLRYISLAIILLELSGVASWSFGLRNSSLSALVGQIYLSIFLFSHMGSWFKGAILANRWLSNLRIPILVLPAISFAVAIIFGALFLWMPGMRRTEIGFLDSLFTAASAICVTGLTVYDVGTALSPIGQIVLAFLIQIGGIGTLSVMGMLTFWSSGNLSLGESAAFSELLGGKQLAETRKIVSTVIKVCVSVEAVGAVLFWLLLRDKMMHPLPLGLFHAISAFCNAGFSLFPKGLVDFSSDYLILGVFLALIVAGGLGFAALADLWRAGISRLVPWRKSLPIASTTRLVVWISFFLITVGAIAYLVDGRISGNERRIAFAVFQSVTLRTAGFQMESQLNFGWLGLLFAFFFMAIGASPQSTGGGVKTTVFARLFLRIDNMEKNDAKKLIFLNHSFRIALLLVIAYLVIAAVAGFAIVFFEGIGPIDALFESFSALGTVGLSRDLTPRLSIPSKVIVILLMFTGRVLFPSFVVSIIRSRRPSEGDVDWA